MKSGQEIVMLLILIIGLVSTAVEPKKEKSAVVLNDEEFAMQAGKSNIGIEGKEIKDYKHVQEQLKECFGQDILEKRK